MYLRRSIISKLLSASISPPPPPSKKKKKSASSKVPLRQTFEGEKKSWIPFFCGRTLQLLETCQLHFKVGGSTAPPEFRLRYTYQTSRRWIHVFRHIDPPSKMCSYRCSESERIRIHSGRWLGWCSLERLCSSRKMLCCFYSSFHGVPCQSSSSHHLRCTGGKRKMWKISWQAYLVEIYFIALNQHIISAFSLNKWGWYIKWCAFETKRCCAIRVWINALQTNTK